MVNHAAQAAALHTFDEKTLRLSKAEIARRSCRDGKTVSQAADEGCGPLHCQQPPVIGRWYTILPPQRSNFSANLQMHVVTGASLRGRTPTRRHASGGVRKNELHSQMFTNRPTEARVNMGLISKRTRNELRETPVGFVLREIEMFFEGAGVSKNEDYVPSVDGARRSLVEQYYAGIDFDSQRTSRSYSLHTER